ncbi:hypothetical protein OKW47_002925 [Paraburkholderia atlantica]
MRRTAWSVPMKNARTVPRGPDRFATSRGKRRESVAQNAFFQPPPYAISASATR